MTSTFARPALVRALVLLLATGAAAPAHAQHKAPPGMDHEEFDPRVAQAKSFTLPASGTVTVPMDTRIGRPIVDVMLNGKGPYRFFVDTGASHTVIDSAVAAEVGLPVLGKTHLGDPANPMAITADRVRIDELAVGDLKFRGVGASSWNQTAAMGMSKSFPVGVIGFPVWHDLLLTLDYVDSTLTAKKGALTASPHTIAFTMPDGVVQLPVAVGGRTYQAHLDTGNGDFCVLPAGETTNVHFTTPLQQIGMARTVNNTFTISGATLDGTVQLADQSYDHPYVTVQGTLPRTNVGGRLLQDYAVSFDQRALLVDFDRKRTTPPPTGPANAGAHGKSAGVGVSPEPDGSLLVAMILPNSAVAAKDVKVGDHIVKLNGQDTKDLTDDQRRALMRKSPVTYTIVRDAKQFDVTVEF